MCERASGQKNPGIQLFCKFFNIRILHQSLVYCSLHRLYKHQGLLLKRLDSTNTKLFFHHNLLNFATTTKCCFLFEGDSSDLKISRTTNLSCRLWNVQLQLSQSLFKVGSPQRVRVWVSLECYETFLLCIPKTNNRKKTIHLLSLREVCLFLATNCGGGMSN